MGQTQRRVMFVAWVNQTTYADQTAILASESGNVSAVGAMLDVGAR